MMASGAQERDLRIAFDIPYKPFEYRNDGGMIPGLMSRSIRRPMPQRLFEAFIFVALCYMVLTFILVFVFRKLENHLLRHQRPING